MIQHAVLPSVIASRARSFRSAKNVRYLIVTEFFRTKTSGLNSMAD